MFEASSRGHDKVIEAILERSKEADVNMADEKGVTPLLAASIGGHHRAIKALLQRQDVDLNRRDECGTSPILAASSRGHELVVQALMSASVTPAVDGNLADGDGLTSLFVACRRDHERYLKT